jgi:oligopeptide transport system substrate-binding protein
MLRRPTLLIALLALLAALSLVLVNCQAQATPEVRVETKTVRETVVVEKIVEKPVEKIVEKPVEKVVERQVVVTPTTPPVQKVNVDLPARRDAPAAAADKQVFRFDLPGDFWPDPLTLTNWWAADGTMVFAGLVTEALPDGKVRPELAEKWEQSADGLTWTFHLNKNAKFSDGSPITSEDVIFSLVGLLDPKGGMPPLYREPYVFIKGYKDFADGKATEISGLKAIDANTVAITLDRPLPWWVQSLGFWQGRIVSKKNVTEGGKEWWRTPVTSGMYKIARFDYGQRNYVELVPNEHYVLGPKPKLQKIIIERITDPTTRLTRYLNNETDYLYNPEPADVAAALRGGQLKDELMGNAIAGQWYFHFRHDRPPFDDRKVRQAFIMATDVDKLGRVVLEGTLAKLTSIIPRGTECWKDVDNSLPYDPVKARQLLAESKYAGKVPEVRFFVSEVLGAPTVGRWTRVATAMAGMWQENLNVPVKIQTKEFEFVEKNEGAFTVARSSRSPLVLDAAALSLWYGSGTSTADQSKLANPDVQKLLDDAMVEKDKTKRCEMYQRADKMLLEDGVFAAAWNIANWGIAKPNVRGLSMQTRIFGYLSYPNTYIAAP